MTCITLSIEPYTHLEGSASISVRAPHPLPARLGANVAGRPAGALPQQCLFPGSSVRGAHVSHGLASEWAELLLACFRSQAGYQIFGHAFMKLIY